MIKITLRERCLRRGRLLSNGAAVLGSIPVFFHWLISKGTILGVWFAFSLILILRHALQMDLITGNQLVLIQCGVDEKGETAKKDFAKHNFIRLISTLKPAASNE